MLTIGITGGVGSGKSEVLSFLEKEYGAVCIRTDLVARSLISAGGRCFDETAALFGPEVIGEDGEFDRSRIAEIVFREKEKLEKLNSITHPAVKEEVKSLICKAEKEGKKYLFLESALLLEEKYDEICDELWYVYAEAGVREQRLMSGRGYSAEKIRSIMANQLSEEVFSEACDFILDNSGTFEETKKKIIEKMSGYNK